MIVIRRFRAEDLSQVVALVESIFREHYEIPMYMNLFSAWPDGFQVADHDGRIVAFLLGMVSGPAQVRVLLLAVSPQYWGHGLGTQLLWTFLRAGRELQATSVTLEVRVSNHRALSFYQRLGFTITGFIPNYYKDGENAHVMERPIG